MILKAYLLQAFLFMREQDRGESTIYSPQESLQKIFRVLTRDFKYHSGWFKDLTLEIAAGTMGDGHYAFLTCEGVYFLNKEQKPVIIALGEINDPHQLTERGDTFLFVMPGTIPEKTLEKYISNSLNYVATDCDICLYEDLGVKIERSLGLIIGHGEFEGTPIAKGGFISVDRRVDLMYAPEEKSWPQRVGEFGEITDGFILKLAQEISKEIGIEVTSH
jgi:hypothetical protein